MPKKLVPKSQNHDSAPKGNYGSAEADDAMSSVGEGVHQYQNHKQASYANHDVVTLMKPYCLVFD